MRTKLSYLSLTLITVLTLLVSCQKEIDGTMDGVINPANLTPKVGTVWTYSYYWWNSPGGTTNAKTINHVARSEETIGTEKWLKIVDVETDTTVYFLQVKADGLYHYANNSANLLCKYPAAINDTYTSFFGGSAKDFTVRGVNDTTATSIGDIPLTKYEAVKAGDIIDVLWYNKNSWIVWKYQYARITIPIPTNVYYLINRMFLEKIVY